MRRARIRPWRPDEAPAPLAPVQPVSHLAKIFAGLGLIGFWLVWLGVVPVRGNPLETAFLLCLICQGPLWWQWLRRQRQTLARIRAARR
jgi:hypothetical protein